jgi:hypothetical protein
MQDSFMAKAAQTCMTMDDLNLFPNDHVAEKWEEREDCWHGRLSIDDQERHMIDLQPIGQIVHTCPTIVRMSYDNNLVPTIDQLGGELVYMAFHSARLRKEEIADHSDVVRHFVGVFWRRIRFMSSLLSIAVRSRGLKGQITRYNSFSQDAFVY